MEGTNSFLYNKLLFCRACIPSAGSGGVCSSVGRTVSTEPGSVVSRSVSWHFERWCITTALDFHCKHLVCYGAAIAVCRRESSLGRSRTVAQQNLPSSPSPLVFTENIREEPEYGWDCWILNSHLGSWVQRRIQPWWKLMRCS